MVHDCVASELVNHERCIFSASLALAAGILPPKGGLSENLGFHVLAFAVLFDEPRQFEVHAHTGIGGLAGIRIENGKNAEDNDLSRGSQAHKVHRNHPLKTCDLACARLRCDATTQLASQKFAAQDFPASRPSGDYR
jgi:hypothetical protein